MCTIQNKVVAEINAQRHPIKHLIKQLFSFKKLFLCILSYGNVLNLEASRKVCLTQV